MMLSDLRDQLPYTVLDISISFPFLVPVHNLSGFCVIIPSVAVVKYWFSISVASGRWTVTYKDLLFGCIAVHFMVETLIVMSVGRTDAVIGASEHSLVN